MGEYRKTATIKAVQWFKPGDHPAVRIDGHDSDARPWIDTLEGGHIVSPGDWIATGIKGEHWPIKPDVFAATYELVSPSPDNPALGDDTLTHSKAALESPAHPLREDVARLQAFAEGSGTPLRPGYVDHAGFDQTDRLRKDLRAALALFQQSPPDRATGELRSAALAVIAIADTQYPEGNLDASVAYRAAEREAWNALRTALTADRGE